MNKITIDGNEVKLSNLNKIFWPEKGYTKGDLINYYLEIYPFIQEFLRNRPLSLKIYPDGIEGKSFFQKNAPDYAPDWLTTYPIYSKQRQEAINWIIANKLSDLVWVINKASIELHCWFSTILSLDKPDFAVFDLDPDPDSLFDNVIEVALLIKEVLDQLNLLSFIKTSGKKGLHIYIPLKPIYTYPQIKNLLKNIADLVIKMRPDLATSEWRKKERKGKVYIDYRQNGQAKTLPVPYSVRPTPAATISTPLEWNELTPELRPGDFTLTNIRNRLDKKGDLWSGLLTINQELPLYILK